MINKAFWKNKKVFLTGHTGFKGSWLSIWLSQMGAKVTGYSLPPPTNPSLFELANVEQCLEKHILGDVRDASDLAKAISENNPEIVFHMAAQPLVRDSYKAPAETYAINVMGTVNLLEAIRLHGKSVRAVINVTTDKVYENKEWLWGYRENEPLGGYDPYSNSKACSELVTSAYRNSYFNGAEYAQHGCAITTARAGNVFGGGDWADDRIVPDCIKAILCNKPITVRNPHAIRPWQHVFEPLSGYLTLAENLYENGSQYAESWNFGPIDSDCKTVEYLVKTIRGEWGSQTRILLAKSKGPHEASYLKLDCSKAWARLGWRPRWNFEKAIASTIAWYKSHASKCDMREICFKQIDEFEQSTALGNHD
jgi:CDP-glucose 4,6-dehydratase